MVATAKTLFSSPLLSIADIACAMPQSGCGCERGDARSSITIIRRGVHAYHARGEIALAEPGLALLYRGGESYRLSHPYEREVPDRSTCIEFGSALLDEVFGSRPLAQDLGLASWVAGASRGRGHSSLPFRRRTAVSMRWHGPLPVRHTIWRASSGVTPA